MEGKLLLTRDGSFATARVGELQIAHCSARQFTDDVWREHLMQQHEHNQQFGRMQAIFVWNPWIGPNAEQRKIALEILESEEKAKKIVVTGNPKPVAIVSESTLVRMMASPFGWMLRRYMNVRMFHPSNTPRAFEWLAGWAKFDRGEAARVLNEMLGREGTTPKYAGGVPLR